MKRLTKLLLFFVVVNGFSQNPNWEMTNASSFVLDATLIVKVLVNNSVLSGPNDRIAAFDSSGEIRGVSGFVASGDSFLAYLSILSNTSGEKITFKIYDSSIDSVIELTDEEISFVASGIFGSPSSPLLYSVSLASLSTDKIETVDSIRIAYKNGQVTIYNSESVTVGKLYNMFGAEFKTTVFTKPSDELQLDISDLPNGVYILSLLSEKEQIFFKFIKS